MPLDPIEQGECERNDKFLPDVMAHQVADNGPNGPIRALDRPMVYSWLQWRPRCSPQCRREAKNVALHPHPWRRRAQGYRATERRKWRGDRSCRRTSGSSASSSANPPPPAPPSGIHLPPAWASVADQSIARTGSVPETNCIVRRVVYDRCSLFIRSFVEKNYKDLKTLNPKLPILIRECRGVEPQLWVRYGNSSLFLAQIFSC